jgi:curli biogenesis system outer membrane secretion channel CsgG
MKHKIIIALFLSLLAATYSVHAQSSSLKKVQAELQQIRQHATEQLAKAHQQQQQAKNETRPSNAPSFLQQPNSNSSKQSGQQQPLLNNPNKKEELNQ